MAVCSIDSWFWAQVILFNGRKWARARVGAHRKLNSLKIQLFQRSWPELCVTYSKFWRRLCMKGIPEVLSTLLDALFRLLKHFEPFSWGHFSGPPIIRLRQISGITHMMTMAMKLGHPGGEEPSWEVFGTLILGHKDWNISNTSQTSWNFWFSNINLLFVV